MFNIEHKSQLIGQDFSNVEKILKKSNISYIIIKMDGVDIPYNKNNITDVYLELKNNKVVNCF
jgi:hypothetical protein